MTCVRRLKEYEDKLREEHGSPASSVFTVSGLVGVGSTTVAEIVSEEFEMDMVSSGTFFRRKASEMDLDLTEFFEKHRNPDVGPDPDLMWDRKVLGLAYTKEKTVLEGRLTGALLCDISDVRILVSCSEDVAVDRLAKRENTEPEYAKKRLLERNAEDIKTYREKYGIDITDEKYYNVFVDNSGSLGSTRKEVVRKIRMVLEE